MILRQGYVGLPLAIRAAQVGHQVGTGPVGRARGTALREIREQTGLELTDTQLTEIATDLTVVISPELTATQERPLTHVPTTIIGRVTLGFLQQPLRDSANPSASVGGDINHCPLCDPEIEWERVQPYNRTSRCLPRAHENDPWRGNRIVGQTFRDGNFTDVAAYVADRNGNPSLLQPTGKAGLLRVDQAHVTQPLVPAIEDYWTVDPGEYADHYGFAFRLNLNKTDTSNVRAYT